MTIPDVQEYIESIVDMHKVIVNNQQFQNLVQISLAPSDFYENEGWKVHYESKNSKFGVLRICLLDFEHL